MISNFITAKDKEEIFKDKHKIIAFAVSNGSHKDDFSLQVCQFWPSLFEDIKNEVKKNNNKENNDPNSGLGRVISHESKEINKTLYAMICHGLGGKPGWVDTPEHIKKCLESIPGEDPIAMIPIGADFLARISFADFDANMHSLIDSKKNIDLYSLRKIKPYFT